MWFFETGVTHLLGRKYQNRCWVGITKIWYTFSKNRVTLSLIFKLLYPLINSKCVILMRKRVNFKLKWMKNYDTKKIKTLVTCTCVMRLVIFNNVCSIQISYLDEFPLSNLFIQLIQPTSLVAGLLANLVCVLFGLALKSYT